jgi:hypothetical protein
MANKTNKTRNFGESLVACAKVLEIGENKIKEGEVNLGSKVKSFANAGFGLESYFSQFNEIAKEVVKDGLGINQAIDESMGLFHVHSNYFKEISNEIKNTSLKDNLLGYFPQELNYIAQRN